MSVLSTDNQKLLNQNLSKNESLKLIIIQFLTPAEHFVQGQLLLPLAFPESLTPLLKKFQQSGGGGGSLVSRVFHLIAPLFPGSRGAVR